MMRVPYCKSMGKATKNNNNKKKSCRAISCLPTTIFRRYYFRLKKEIVEKAICVDFRCDFCHTIFVMSEMLHSKVIDRHFDVTLNIKIK